MTESSMGTFKQRYANLDLLKDLAIFLVIFYHVGGMKSAQIILAASPSNLMSFVDYALASAISLCMPLFFLVNGMLLLNRPLSIRAHIRKIVSIILLMIFWSFATQLIFSEVGIYQQKLTIPNLIRNTYALPFPLNNHLWFMEALGVLYIVFPLIKAVYDHERAWFNFFLVIVIICTVGNETLNMMVNIFHLFRTGAVEAMSNKQFLVASIPYGVFTDIL